MALKVLTEIKETLDVKVQLDTEEREVTEDQWDPEEKTVQRD